MIELFIWWLMIQGWISSGKTKRISREDGQCQETKLEESRTSDSSVKSSDPASKGLLRRTRSWWRYANAASQTEVLLLQPLEFVNFVWLMYILFAQTVGAYQNCECFSAIWIGQGRYVDFTTWSSYSSNSLTLCWAVATALSCAVMCIGFAYIVAEYCTQAHISTDHYGRAMQGLQTTRRYKKYTRRVRMLLRDTFDFCVVSCRRMLGLKSRPMRKTLRWDWRTKDRADLHRLLQEWSTSPDLDDGALGGSILRRGRTYSTAVEVPLSKP